MKATLAKDAFGHTWKDADAAMLAEPMRNKALQHPCPYCSAPPGKKCIAIAFQGTPMHGVHMGRLPK